MAIRRKTFVDLRENNRQFLMISHTFTTCNEFFKYENENVAFKPRQKSTKVNKGQQRSANIFK